MNWSKLQFGGLEKKNDYRVLGAWFQRNVTTAHLLLTCLSPTWSCLLLLVFWPALLSSTMNRVLCFQTCFVELYASRFCVSNTQIVPQTGEIHLNARRTKFTCNVFHHCNGKQLKAQRFVQKQQTLREYVLGLLLNSLLGMTNAIQ